MARPIIPLQNKLDLRLDRVVVNPESACWIWSDVIDQDGYGIIQHTEKNRVLHLRAHRLSYEKFKGKIPEGLVIDHLCRTRCCVNPNHLEVVTISENTKRGGRSLKTHCPKGHPYDGDNLYLASVNHRQCRECRRQYWKRYRPPSKRK